MSDHDHDHDHDRAARKTKYGALDPAVTKRLKAEAAKEGATPVGHFLGMAANCKTESERVFWLGKVDSARYFHQRAEAKAALDASARRNMEADGRLLGTEASLTLHKVVGNACILLLDDPKDRPAPGGWSLVRRKSGETGESDEGAPRNGQWVIQGLDSGIVHEFAVVSADSMTAKSVKGPWLSVPIGEVTTEQVQRAEEKKAKAQYEENEASEARKAREHSEKVATDRQARSEAIKAQEEEARRQNAVRERDIKEKMDAHEKAVKELHLCAPVGMELRLRNLKKAGMVCDITFQRGRKKCDLFQFKVDGTVLGYFPDGRHSGRKPDGHVYERTVTVPRGRDVEIHVYAVTKHGNAGDPVTIPVPQSLCDPEQSRWQRVLEAVKGFTGRRTESGKPWVRPLRKQSGIRDITIKERDKAHEETK